MLLSFLKRLTQGATWWTHFYLNLSPKTLEIHCQRPRAHSSLGSPTKLIIEESQESRVPDNKEHV